MVEQITRHIKKIFKRNILFKYDRNLFEGVTKIILHPIFMQNTMNIQSLFKKRQVSSKEDFLKEL